MMPPGSGGVMAQTHDSWTLKANLFTLYRVTPMRLASGERGQLAAAWTDERNCLNLLRLVVNFRNLYFATGAET